MCSRSWSEPVTASVTKRPAADIRCYGPRAPEEESVRPINLSIRDPGPEKPERTAGSDEGRVRVGNQSEGRQRDRIERPASTAAPRRQDDRITFVFAALKADKEISEGDAWRGARCATNRTVPSVRRSPRATDSTSLIV